MSITQLDSPANLITASTPPAKFLAAVKMMQPIATRMAASRLGYWIAAAAISSACLALVWWQQWIAEDAFISFRYVANVWEGNGLVWNAGERVQGFTCPLWQLLLCAMPSEITPLWSLLMGMGFTFLTLLVAGRMFAGTKRPIVGFLLFCAGFFSSKSVLQWSTSGLENSLNHALLALVYAAAFAPRQTHRIRLGICIAGGFLLFNRLDQALAVAPLLLFVHGTVWREGRWRIWWRSLAIGFSSLFAWLIFAAIYYGYPLPNTSYSKLAAPLAAQVQNGLLCMSDFIRCEPWHALLILAAPLLIFPASLSWRVRGRAVLGCISASIILQAVYFLYIGGDYMRGRFFTSDIFLAALAGAWLVANAPTPAPRRLITAVAFILLLLPIGAWANWHEPIYDGPSGVVRLASVYEPFDWIQPLKGRHYWRLSEIRKYQPQLDYCTDAILKLNTRAGTHAARTQFMLGESTYADLKTPVIDPLGLTDPYIARCWGGSVHRPGHIQRDIPTAYLIARQCISAQPDWQRRLGMGDVTLVTDAASAARHVKWARPSEGTLYRELEILTRGPIFSAERFRLIFKYTFTHPLPFEKRDHEPLILPVEIPNGFLTLSPHLQQTVQVLGITPSGPSFGEIREFSGCWLGPRDVAPLSLHIYSAGPVMASLSFLVTSLGSATPSEGNCTLRISVNGQTQQLVPVSGPGMYLTQIQLYNHRNVIKIATVDPPGGLRPMHDPRPLVAYLRRVALSDDLAASQCVRTLGMRLLDPNGTTWFVPTVFPGNTPPISIDGELGADNTVEAVATSSLAGSWCDVERVQHFWLGPRENGQFSVLIATTKPTPARLSFHACVGPDSPPGGCPVISLLNDREVLHRIAKGPADMSADLRLEPGLNCLTFRVPADARPAEDRRDMRRLMVLVSGVRLFAQSNCRQGLGPTDGDQTR